MNDLISRQAAIDRIQGTGYADAIKNNLMLILRLLPSAQPDSCEFYDTESHFCALHRPSAQPDVPDTNVGDMKSCIYCHEDSDGYVTPIEKNCHAFIRFGMNGCELSLKAKGWHGSAKIKYCPMCGRRLTDG